jgi:formylglycine-generating enzyme required for sulfatase activity
LTYLENIFSKYPYLSGISLDEPTMRVNECFCDACKVLFAQKYPAGKMDMHSDDFRKFREYVWGEYYLKPYADLLRRLRPANGVLVLAAPGIQKAWGMGIEGISTSGIQVFAYENAQTKSSLKFHDYWARYILEYIPCIKASVVKKHPLLKKMETISASGKAVAVDVFKGAETLAYVTDGVRSYPGIVAANDTSTVYFSFNPLETPNLISNTLGWFMENDRHDVPKGMSVIPSGAFSMKVPKDDPLSSRFPEDMIAKETFVDKFYLDILEVSNKEYEKYDPKHKRSDLSSGDDMPVVNVSMNDAKKFCNWRSVAEGLSPVYVPSGRKVNSDLSKNGYRLPTVAEWQKAAVGPEHMRYSWGNHFWKASGRVGMDFNDGAVAVGSYRPNYYGVFDMSGNVWEWCEGYEDFPKRQGRICGGAWHNDEAECDLRYYNFLYENHTRSTIGFRCARNADDVIVKK